MNQNKKYCIKDDKKLFQIKYGKDERQWKGYKTDITLLEFRENLLNCPREPR